MVNDRDLIKEGIKRWAIINGGNGENQSNTGRASDSYLKRV
jgi:hypothetical protein